MNKDTGCLECEEIQKDEPFPPVGMCIGCKMDWNIAQMKFHISQLEELIKEKQR